MKGHNTTFSYIKQLEVYFFSLKLLSKQTNFSLAFAIEVIDHRVKHFSWIPIKRCDFHLSSHVRVCVRSIMYSCITLEFHLPFLFGKNCSSAVHVIFGMPARWKDNFLLLESFHYWSPSIFNLYCTTKTRENAHLPRPRIVVLHRKKYKK